MRKTNPQVNSQVPLLWRLMACAIFSVIVVYVPWNFFSGNDKFPDIENYVNNTSQILSELERGSENIYSVIFSEPAWKGLLFLFHSLDIDTRQALRFVSVSCALAISFFTISKSRVMISLALLLNPLIIDLVNSQTRSALALSFCMVALSTNSRKAKFLFAVLATLTHSATFIGLTIYLVAELTKRKSHLNRILWMILTSIVVALAISIGRTNILSYVGDRRVDYNVETGSFLYVAFWFVLSIYLMLDSKKNPIEKSGETVTAICLMIVPAITTLLDTNGTRFLALGLPFLIIAISGFSNNARIIYYLIISMYQLIQFFYWLQN